MSMHMHIRAPKSTVPQIDEPVKQLFCFFDNCSEICVSATSFVLYTPQCEIELGTGS